MTVVSYVAWRVDDRNAIWVCDMGMSDAMMRWWYNSREDRWVDWYMV